MTTGTIKTIVQMLRQTYLTKARLVPDVDEEGYGVIEDAEGHEVYFAHAAIAGRFGFDELREGLLVEYALEAAPYLYMAKSVRRLPQ